MVKLKCLCKLVCLFVVAALSPQTSYGNGDKTFSFIVVADTAYKVPHDYRSYDKLIGKINAEKPAFTIHLGDVFSGQTDCGSPHIERVKTDFGKYTQPVVYTPGDNEWTDCHRAEAGGYDPAERLENLRRLFFAAEHSLGQGRLHAVSQANEGLIENARWVQGDILFATLHIVGSNNGLTTEGNPEFEFRNQANLRWIKEAFKQANDHNAKAVVLAYHANMFTEPDGADGFADVRALIGQLGEEFQKPVLLVHGDHHQFVIDRPYLPKLKKGPGANITRLQTYGWPDAKAVKIMVDTASAHVFSFQPVFVEDGFY